MTLALYCLVGDSCSELSLDTIAVQLQEYFSTVSGFKQKYEEDPFDPSDGNLLLFWGNWWIRIFYEEGSTVRMDSEEIAKYADPGRMPLISAIDRRVRVLFADDEDLAYTNHVIFMMDFLESSPDLIIFDPQRKTFVN